jgi:pre-mRNA-splicing factor ISY1
MKLVEEGKVRPERRRPYSIMDESNPRRAERWRNQVIKEIAKKVAQIQNAGLGEFKIRDLNDEINKLLREKEHWEDRIKELGGPDFKKLGPKLLDQEGKEVPSNRGYKYFGAAKDLPGVKELFEEQEIKSQKKTRTEMLREIDADYYGYLDDEDNLLIPQEQKCEIEARAKKIQEFKEKIQTKENETEEMETESEGLFENDTNQQNSLKKKTKNIHVDVPSQQEIAEALLERKKKELLMKYVSVDQMEQEIEAKQLSGRL